jgi:hypothetical protein
VTPTERRRRNRLADVLWLAETGENLTGAATRLGIDPESLRSHGADDTHPTPSAPSTHANHATPTNAPASKP